MDRDPLDSLDFHQDAGPPPGKAEEVPTVKVTVTFDTIYEWWRKIKELLC